MRISRRGLIVALGALVLVTGCVQREAGNSSSAATNAPGEQTESARLVGKWQRLDGGYVLDIRGTSENGKLDAGYFNPNPIHVSQATWQRSEELGLVVFVELRDTGYPGATYHLQYRAADDKLAGAYTQPAVGQTFDVEFVRQP